MKLQIGMDLMLKLLREFINQTGFAVQGNAFVETLHVCSENIN
jgi:hypothetical protein